MRKILFIIAFLTIMMPSKAQKWLTHVDYDDHQTGLHMGYTSQQFKFYSGDYYFVSDGIWGDKNRLHGFDIGVVVQGNWGYGIGLYWALHTEFYFSTNNPTETYHATSVNGAYDFYGEFTFQMPLHLALKIPLTDEEYDDFMEKNPEISNILNNKILFRPWFSHRSRHYTNLYFDV